MQEKRQVRPPTQFPQTLAGEQQMVVMHPDEIFVGGVIQNHLGIMPVDLLIHPTVFRIEIAQGLQVMK